MNEENTKPFIIIGKSGNITELLQTNLKGYRKSIENNQIWAINPETGRLLPSANDYKTTAFSDKGDWYEAVVDTEDKIESCNTIEDESCGNSRNEIPETADGVINSLFNVIERRRRELPEGSYTTHLFNSGISKIKKKTGEEAVELILAEDHAETVYEAADLIYHMLVLLSASGIRPDEVFKELKSRE